MTTRVIMIVCCVTILFAPVLAMAVEADKKPVEPAPAAAQDQKPVFTYDPTGRREPFKSLIDNPPITKIPITPVIDDPSPLQKFELQELRVIGIIRGGLGDYARVLAPDGKTYTVKVGDPVGKFEGKVLAITANAVAVKEIKRFQVGDKIEVEEPETPLYLSPVKQEQMP